MNGVMIGDAVSALRTLAAATLRERSSFVFKTSDARNEQGEELHGEELQGGELHDGELRSEVSGKESPQGEEARTSRSTIRTAPHGLLLSLEGLQHEEPSEKDPEGELGREPPNAAPLVFDERSSGCALDCLVASLSDHEARVAAMRCKDASLGTFFFSR